MRQALAGRTGRWAAYFAITLGYVVTGKAGLLLAVPPGYATAIFPPAGIAVAAMLVGGTRTLPWTFLGSLLLNVWEGWGIEAGLAPRALAVAAVIAAASTLQAGVTGGVLRKALGDPAPLADGRDIARFLLLTPLCCLLSASLSLTGMRALGALSVSELARSWVTWWVGDTLGVVFVLPLVLVLAGQPRGLWRARALPVAVPMLLFFALFVLIFARVSAWESDQSLLEFRILSQHVTDRIKGGLERQEEFLDQLGRSFSRPVKLSRAEFHGLIDDLSLRFPTVQAIAWAPRVAAVERAAFEAAQRRDNPQFAIRERDAAGTLQPAAARAEYFPLTYLEPFAANAAVQGLDLASFPDQRAALETAIDRGSIAATAPLHVARDRTQWGILIMRVVHSRANGTGVIISSLRLGDFMAALVDPSRATIGVELVDLDRKTTLYNGFARGPPASVYESRFTFGTRHYRLSMEPTAAYLADHRTWESWAVLVAGLVSTALLGALLMLATGQAHRFEQVLAERTRDLQATNDRLTREFAERQQAEAALRQAQKMEAVGQLTGGIAHDFNNLLTVIAGNLDLLKRHVTDAAARRLIDAAERGTERSTRLVQSLLAFSRRQVLRPETVDANRLIREFEALLRQAAVGLGELQFRLSPDLERCVVDAAQFETALLNLLTNARDALPPTGGRVTVETANVAVDATLQPDAPPGRYVRVTVADNGVGMSATVVARAFEPFYTTKEVGKGSGLGLSQVYGFAQQSDGFVQLDSEEGRGTAVALFLPSAQRAPAAGRRGGQVAPLPRAARAGEAVLVVDDDDAVRATTAEMIRALGYRVLTAPDGPAALALIESGEAIDLLVTDYVLPRGMQGDDVAVLARRVRREIKVLLTSGHAAGAEAGFQVDRPFLRKPFRQDDLARAIRAALGQ
jgi:signal transduction histidine kinase/CheY-like chemotaxis protein